MKWMTFLSILFFAGPGLASECEDLFPKGNFAITGDAKVPYDPVSFLDFKVQEIIRLIESRDTETPEGLSPRTLHIRAKRNSLHDIFFDEKIVEHGRLTQHLADKLIAAKVLQHYLGPKYPFFHPPSEGLLYFLISNRVIDSDGRVLKNEEQIRQLFESEFPDGFLIKPTFAWSTGGHSGLFLDPDEVYRLIQQGSSELFTPRDLVNPFVAGEFKPFPPILLPLSGEKFMIQGLVKGTRSDERDFRNFSVNSDLSHSGMNEYRVHTFQDKVVEGATVSRWETRNSKAKIEKVNQFSQQLMDSLPKSLTNRQAWSLDVMITPDGDLKLIEINTNRGWRTNWSGWLKFRWILKAHVRHLESEYGWKFTGISGWMLRNGLGNLKSHFRGEIVEDQKAYGKGQIPFVGYGLIRRELNFQRDLD